jgi:hypothetical protein
MKGGMCYIISDSELADILKFYKHVNTQGDQKVSVHLKITIQKVTSNVQSVPRQSPYIY